MPRRVATHGRPRPQTTRGEHQLLVGEFPAALTLLGDQHVGALTGAPDGASRLHFMHLAR